MIAYPASIDILVIEVENYLIPAPFQHLFQTRYFVGRHIPVSIDQIKLKQFFISVINHTSLPRSRTIDR